MSNDELDLYEAFARLGDLHSAIGDIYTKLAQIKAKAVTKDYDVEKITYVPKMGANGEYEYADPKTEGAKPDFKALLSDLKAHDGKMTIAGKFYWLFRDSAGIGRKKASYEKKQ